MARRYVTRPVLVAYDDWDAVAVDFLARTVHEQDRSPRPTGLLDAHGDEIFAVDEAEPIGFIRHKDH